MRGALATWALGSAGVIHLVVGLALIGRDSLWGDEAFSAETVRLPLGDLLAMLTRIDVNMSAYYLLLKGWSSLFGTSEVALRLPSLLMTTATVLIAGHLVSRWFGPLSGLVTGIALGLSPYFLAVGLTARSFGMLALVSTVSVACLVRALGRPAPAPWLVLALVDALALYTSLLAALVIAAQVAYVVIVDRRIMRAQAAAIGALLVASVPALMYLAPPDTLNWLVTRDVRSLVGIGYSVAGQRYGLLLSSLAFLGLVLRPKPSGASLGTHPRSRYLLPALVLTPLAIMVALLPRQSLFTPPYLVTMFVAAAMAAGAVTARFRPLWTWVTAAALVLTLGAGVAMIQVPHPGLDQQDWRAAIARLDEAVQPGDTVVFPNTFYRAAGEYYARGGRMISVSVPALPSDQWLSQPPDTYDRLKRTGYYNDPTRVLDGLTGRDRVWLVGPEGEFMSLFSSTLANSGWTMTSEQSVTGLTIRSFARTRSSA